MSRTRERKRKRLQGYYVSAWDKIRRGMAPTQSQIENLSPVTIDELKQRKAP